MAIEDLSPGLAALVAITADDPMSEWLINELDVLARKANAQGVKPSTFMAITASTIGHAIGHGVKRRQLISERTRNALEREVLLAESILEDSAEHAYSATTGGRSR